MGYFAVPMKRREVSTKGFNFPLYWPGIVMFQVSPCSISEGSSTREQKPKGKGADSAQIHWSLKDAHNTQAPLSTTATGEFLCAHRISPSNRPAEQTDAFITVQTAR